MEEVGHSPLLKFFVGGYKTKMSEPNIESEVPGEQNIREGHNQNEPQEGPSTQNATLSLSSKDEVATESFTLEPVITVTKQETTLTKGEMKLQKVTVTEDISVRYQHLFKKQTTPGKTVVTTVQRLDYKY